MPKKIIWSRLAENDFANFLDYLDNTLFYRDTRLSIEILRIYDTRQDADTLTFK